MVQQQVPRELLVFRRFIKRCMEAKNLKGQPPEVIRAELADCARRFREARERLQPMPPEEIDRLAEQAAREFLGRGR